MNARSNVDPQEIAKFEALASRWWDRNSEFKPLHDINPLRANYIDEHSPVAGQHLVDIGCGGGLVCEPLARLRSKLPGNLAGLCAQHAVLGGQRSGDDTQRDKRNENGADGVDLRRYP